MIMSKEVKQAGEPGSLPGESLVQGLTISFMGSFKDLIFVSLPRMDPWLRGIIELLKLRKDF